MNSVVQVLTKEIEYLGALAEMYRQGRDAGAHAAALEAKAALERLLGVVEGSHKRPTTDLLSAA